jgi:hypothetical protein
MDVLLKRGLKGLRRDSNAFVLFGLSYHSMPSGGSFLSLCRQSLAPLGIYVPKCKILPTDIRHSL